MSLKSIRESYSKLLKAFKEAGVKLSESQKSDIDAFVLAIESTMRRRSDVLVRTTRKLVEARMERQYKELFESVMANMQKNAELASKIESKVVQINESKKIADKVNDYLDLYVESVLPKKTIVDYDRMQKLEKIQESLRDALLVNEDAVEEKIQKLEESYKVKASKCETRVAKMRVKLNESMKKESIMKKRLDSVKAVELLESKTKDLPAFEARQVKKQLKDCDVNEIEKTFDETLESVRKGMKEADKSMEKTLESQIEKIIDCDPVDECDGVDEDDMLRNRPHNAHKSVDECDGVDEDDMLRNRPHNAHKSVEEDDGVDEDDMLRNRPHNAHKSVEEDDDIFETMEIIRMNENGDVELDESDIIDSELMNLWCRQAVEVR